ncbi:MAG: membrane protein insertase YidC [Rikenellaceae bacterium]|jgi:YidC/Oxa1 family membrane protein insertase|nr:membrane protein insertase YidC [Rikenellaceae bacterium]
MDKKSIIGLVVIAIILFGFSWYNSNQQNKLNEDKRIQDSIERVRLERVTDSLAKLSAPEHPAQEQDSAARAAYQQQLSSSLGGLYGSLQGTEQFFTVENDVMAVKFSNKGGRVATVMIKDYKCYDGEPLYMFDQASSKFDLSFFTGSQVNTSDFYFTPVSPGSLTVTGAEGAKAFAMRLYADSAAYIEYLYTIRPDDYMIDFDVRLVGMERLIAQNQSDFLIRWENSGFQNEKGYDNENNNTSITYMYPNEYESLEEMGLRSTGTKEESVKSRMKWIGFKQQFFSSIIVAEDAFENGSIRSETYPAGSGYIKKFHAQLSVPYTPQTKEYAFHFYFGPNKFNVLKQYELGFQRIIPLGGWMIGWINRLIVIPVFDFLSQSIANFGLIILILTILLKIIITPLTYKSYLSTAKMRLLKPEIEEINKKFPKADQAAKKQQATMELYSKAGVSPLGGCIPMLIQFPILIAMFRFFPASIELRGESFLWADDLSSYDSILNLPFNIPLYGDHVSLFTLLMAVAMVVSSRISYNQTSGTTPQMAGMKFVMLYMMPLMMVVWFNNYSSGLSYYYTLSTLITIGQMYGFRYLVNEEKLHQKMKENAKKPKKKSKFMQRYEEAMRQQQAQAERQKNQRK